MVCRKAARASIAARKYGDDTPSSNYEKRPHTSSNFCCRVCEQTKPLGQFSNRELQAYQKKARGQVLIPRDVQPRCHQCSGQQVYELECQGPCSLWKSIDDFSKNQRRGDPDRAWCITCTEWKIQAEFGQATAPAPSEILDLDDCEHATMAELDTVDFNEYRCDDDSDSEDEYSHIYVPYKAMSVTDTRSSSGESFTTAAETAMSASEVLPQHLRPEVGREMAQYLVSEPQGNENDKTGRLIGRNYDTNAQAGAGTSLGHEDLGAFQTATSAYVSAERQHPDCPTPNVKAGPAPAQSPGNRASRFPKPPGVKRPQPYLPMPVGHTRRKPRYEYEGEGSDDEM